PSPERSATVAPDKTPMARNELPPPPAEPGPAFDNHATTLVLRKQVTTPAPPRSELEWPRVRGYEVLSVIGSGGTAVVYKARQRDLRRTVALKMIRATVLAD